METNIRKLEETIIEVGKKQYNRKPLSFNFLLLERILDSIYS